MWSFADVGRSGRPFTIWPKAWLGTFTALGTDIEHDSHGEAIFPRHSLLSTMLSTGLSLIPPDTIFETTKLSNADSNPRKVNLGQGTYKDAYGRPFVFLAVKEAKQRLLDGNHEYLPILGLSAFGQEANKLLIFYQKQSSKARYVGFALSVSASTMPLGLRLL